MRGFNGSGIQFDSGAVADAADSFKMAEGLYADLLLEEDSKATGIWILC